MLWLWLDLANTLCRCDFFSHGIVLSILCRNNLHTLLEPTAGNSVSVIVIGIGNNIVLNGPLQMIGMSVRHILKLFSINSILSRLLC